MGIHCFLKKNDTYVINPLNWKIDETPAYKSDNMGILLLNVNPKTYEFNFAISNDENHKYDAKINLERGSLITSERPEEEYVNIESHGKIWGGKSLHFFDCMAFYVNIGRNFLNRLHSLKEE